MDTLAVTLPGGISVDGAWRRDAVLRPLNGSDEAFLGEEGRFLQPAVRTTALLSRTLSSIGPLRPATPDTVRALTVGDRDALLLHLRRAAFGDRIACVLRCPDISCAEMMDLDLNVGSLLAPPYDYEQEIYETPIDEEDLSCTVRFRLPRGADQEAASGVAVSRGVDRAHDLLVERCVESVDSEGGADAAGDRLRQALTRYLPATMLELDPQAEIRLNMNCSTCGGSFSLLFDPAAYFFEELSGGVDELYREVHLLAFHYHWSETEILSLTNHRRRRYVSHLVEAVRKRGLQ